MVEANFQKKSMAVFNAEQRLTVAVNNFLKKKNNKNVHYYDNQFAADKYKEYEKAECELTAAAIASSNAKKDFEALVKKCAKCKL